VPTGDTALTVQIDRKSGTPSEHVLASYFDDGLRILLEEIMKTRKSGGLIEGKDFEQIVRLSVGRMLKQKKEGKW
jgi:hypothetical protein